MVAVRLHMDRLQELVRLHRIGNKGRTVARLLRMSPNTEQRYRKALLRAGLLLGEVQALPELTTLKAAVAEQIEFRPAQQEVSSIAAWSDRVEALLEKGAGPQAIFDCLKLEDDKFKGSLSAVKRLCRRLRGTLPVKAEDVVISVQTAPGEIAQVDFGYVGKILDPASGQLRKTWVFALVLGYSRQMVVRLVFDQRIETWLQLHVEAFTELGGVVRTVVPDNLKAAVVRAAFAVDEVTGLQRSYRELARHYGFQIDPAPVRQPAKKGLTTYCTSSQLCDSTLQRTRSNRPSLPLELAWGISPWRFVQVIRAIRVGVGAQEPPGAPILHCVFVDAQDTGDLLLRQQALGAEAIVAAA